MISNYASETMSDVHPGLKIYSKFSYEDDRGRLNEMWTNENAILDTKHVYITHCRPGIVKAWHYHEIQIDKFFCVRGALKIIVYNSDSGAYYMSVLSEYDQNVLVIPSKLWHGFATIGNDDAYIVNMATEPYNSANPDERRSPWNSFLGPDIWEVQNG